MRSGARRGRGSRFPEGRGRRALVAPPQNGCSGRACAAARAGGVVRVSRRGEGGARRVAPPRNGCSGRACAAARAGGVVRVSQRGEGARAGGTGTRFSRRGEGGASAGELVRAFPGGGGRREPGELVRAFPGGKGRRALVARRVMQGDGGARRFRGIMQEGAEGRRFRRVMREDGGAWWPGGWLPCRFVRHFVTGRGVAVKRGLHRWPSGVAVKRVCVALSGCPPLVGSNGGCAADRRGLL